MAYRNLRVLVVLLLVFLAYEEVWGENKLQSILRKKREAPGELMPSEAQEFLSVRRPKRNVWDRNRADVQQWIMQFMAMGFDEARLETDLSYWRDYYRSNDQGRQHHYDENAPLGPQHRTTYRHGANVNYDYY